ncbi:MAG: short-chain dehydrogenase [Gemmatales bacterium]|nr:MAG: short-chain dehydrogenase [Gemmatales bacterium]
MSFADRIAFITGASSGIGWEVAKELARQGCKVGLVARRQEALEKLADEIATHGGVAASAPADVSDRKQVQSAFRELADRLGPCDLLVANAGVGVPSFIEPFNIADVERMIRVNLFGVIYAVEAVLPAMLRRGSGHLAAVSSLAAYKGLPVESGYCASKAAVNTYMESLRIQLRYRGIHVTTICPGFVRTPMTEVNQFHMPWLMEADEAARRIVRALARRKKVYNFPWQTTLLMKVTRWLPDWVIAQAMAGYDKSLPRPGA